MRDDISLAAILGSVQAATPEPLPFASLSLFDHPNPGVRRAMRMMRPGRQETFDMLVDILAAETETPEWIARMAVNAAIPDGRERELDDPGGIAPALGRAKVAMGFKPCQIAGREPIPLSGDWPDRPQAA